MQNHFVFEDEKAIGSAFKTWIIDGMTIMSKPTGISLRSIVLFPNDLVKIWEFLFKNVFGREHL